MCCKRQNRKIDRKCNCLVVNHGEQGEKLSNWMTKVFLYGLLWMQETCIEVGFPCACASVCVLWSFCSGYFILYLSATQCGHKPLCESMNEQNVEAKWNTAALFTALNQFANMSKMDFVVGNRAHYIDWRKNGWLWHEQIKYGRGCHTIHGK